MSSPLQSSLQFPSSQKQSMTTIDEVLDLFHAAASNADLETYFNSFTADGYFMGTDMNERWTVPEFYLYAKPYFERGHGWTYKPISRNITYHNTFVAWFDEILHNERFGMTRSSGVVTRDDQNQWKIAQYHLTVPIPNHLMDTVVQIIKPR